MGILLMHQMHN